MAGSIFVQYDAILDLPNFMHFVSEVLTPGVYKGNNTAANNNCNNNNINNINANIKNSKV